MKVKSSLKIQPMQLTQPQAVNLNPDGLQQKLKNSQTNAMFAQKWSSHAPTVKLMKNKFILGSVNFKHSCIHLAYVSLHEVTWRMVVWCTQTCTETAAVSCATSYARAVKYITLVDIKKKKKKKMRYKKLVTPVESHVSAVSAWEWRIALYKSNHHHQCPQDMKTKSSDHQAELKVWRKSTFL